LKPSDSSQTEPPAPASSALVGYGAPLLVAAALCAWTWPQQVDRIAFDEVREAMRAIDLHSGAISFARSWQESVHPPLVPWLTSVALYVFPAWIACRLPQVLCGFITVALLVGLGRRTGRPRVGLAAGLLLAASPIWWAYSCAVSLDLPLACVTALAAWSCAGARPRFLYLLLALLLATAVKRQGLTLVGMASLLALGAKLSRRGPWLPLVLVLGAAGVGALGIRSYLAGGLEIFGVVRRIDELVSTTPVILGVAAFGVLGLVTVLWRVGTDGRRVLLPYALFVAPLVVAPMISSHPAPRYFLPALPIAALLGAAAIWFGGFGGGLKVRILLSVVAILGSTAVQAWDLHRTYWPRQRGLQDAVTWIADHVPQEHVVLSPSGRFLQLAQVFADVRTAPILDVDRTTCARIENQLARARSPAWVVLPLYREIGWPADVPAHAAAMGLELVALVRRDVPEAIPPTPWREAHDVPTLGPADGTPVVAILRAAARPDEDALTATVPPLTLARFADPSALGGWDVHGVTTTALPDGEAGVRLAFVGGDQPVAFPLVFELRGDETELITEAGAIVMPDLPHIQARDLPVTGAFATVDWHHHRALDLEVRGDAPAMDHIVLSVGLRRGVRRVQLAALPADPLDDGWLRVHVRFRATPEDLSKVEWVGLSAWRAPGDGGPVTLDLRAIGLR
jgi:hypothetical protein